MEIDENVQRILDIPEQKVTVFNVEVCDNCWWGILKSGNVKYNIAIWLIDRPMIHKNDELYIRIKPNSYSSIVSIRSESYWYLFTKYTNYPNTTATCTDGPPIKVPPCFDSNHIINHINGRTRGSMYCGKCDKEWIN